MTPLSLVRDVVREDHAQARGEDVFGLVAALASEANPSDGIVAALNEGSFLGVRRALPKKSCLSRPYLVASCQPCGQ